jgi:hypothetical protein
VDFAGHRRAAVGVDAQLLGHDEMVIAARLDELLVDSGRPFAGATELLAPRNRDQFPVAEVIVGSLKQQPFAAIP